MAGHSRSSGRPEQRTFSGLGGDYRGQRTRTVGITAREKARARVARQVGGPKHDLVTLAEHHRLTGKAKRKKPSTGRKRG